MVMINIINFLVISSSNNNAEKRPKYMQYVVYLLNTPLYVSVCLCSNVYNIPKYPESSAVFFLKDSVRFVTQPELHF